MMILHWGIVGAGKISHDFVTALNVNPALHIVHAVASCRDNIAEKFAEDHNISHYYSDYESIATDRDIDIVYIGNLNTQHYRAAKLMLENGKPVLCEKPFTMNEKQTTELVELARSKNIFLMEAVWSRCFPVYREMRRMIDSGAIGEVMYTTVNFGFPLQHIQRLTSREMGGGAILDLGVYILQFQQYVFRGLHPTKVVVNGHLNQQGTDESVAAVITYPGGKMAVVGTSARTPLPNEAVVAGSRGVLKLPNFWCPTQLITDAETYEYELPSSNENFIHYNSAGLYYEAEEVRLCIEAGRIESEHMPHSESIELAKLMDTFRKEVGVEFPEDHE